MTCGECYEVKEDLKDEFVDSGKGRYGLGVGTTSLLTHPRQHYLLAYAGRGVQLPKEIRGLSLVTKRTEPVVDFSLRRYPAVRTLDVRQYPVVRTLDSYVRPVSGGNSVSAWSNLLGGYVTGTVGLAAQNNRGQTVILSNNHVLCGIDTVQRGGANAGTPVFQPGAYFGGEPGADNFATLYQWGRIDEVGANRLDWATALVQDPTQVSDQVLNVGTPVSVADFLEGMQVVKTGALSGYTTGQVIDVSATIEVNYENLFTATFDDQVIVQGSQGGPFAVPGDSGSAAVARAGDKVVAGGLVFSGSSTIAVLNKMTLVQQAAGLTLPVGTFQAAGTPATTPNGPLLAFVGAASYFLTRKVI